MKSLKNKYLLLLICLLLVSTSATAANDTIGVNSSVKGDVTISTSEQQAKQAMIKDPVLLGDVVTAASQSSLQVLLLDQTVFTVGPDSLLTIDEFIYNPKKRKNTMTARVQKGMFRFISGNISKSKRADVSVNTPVASMGVRGTIVEGLIGNDAINIARNAGVLPAGSRADIVGASLFVLRGPGPSHRSINKRGEITVTSAGVTKTTDGSGMAIFVPDVNSPPSDPFQLPFFAYKMFQDNLRTEPTSPQSYKPFDLGIQEAPGVVWACDETCNCQLYPANAVPANMELSQK